ncbi:hypothetical protein A2643_04000 [Candidatus Nomurabacteria bacterium RIFCSPHIGHO2_01_FULL_39_220]|uniref:Uncharacterized protein n=1 Tax=Candidatus Nomurabacteria bacterium RIFCSPLOWO2_02_FULL_40_67 TaxID=1801787 RepID=A0A1F6Y5M3_9BACT|nr:MAG: putative phage protein [Parcubacteria group bacterium GW2011_GWA2_40_37]KKS11223.1 MAG: putative phage protein [Parcubacteria group bacterium GW2011_GWB1_41_5]OGI62840.1 MAG: hypothetical protein A2W12_03570 [Candidatus Nomurabacteria bacterium RBG_16_40_11]OGI69767.1 MAG: hypothetical protein A2643_04000 [Candidatus Nomurabacteria bacterium RIFCSPHIGHO2_01_FULL_39_220]OGI72625.1 MAG: hypothetical protein A2W56_01575 [Candidatus Nomurabacteria bacterium RIFCSPHIGHO2_02_41_18]OGI78488.1
METENKICQNCGKDFSVESNDFGFYEKMGVPAPSKCPECRQQLRTLFRNFKTLYKRPSSKSGKMIISVYDADAPFPVYDISEWWGDEWDAISYGVDVDLDEPFFSQLIELFNTVPHVSIMNSQTENCKYSNQINQSKNCYLIFGGLNDEDCDYGHIVWNSRDSIDNLYLFKCESCYECIDCLNSGKLFYSQECEACVNSIGLFDCRNCLNCIGCVGLVSKSYYIFNKPVTREEYRKFLLEHPLNEKSYIDFILKERESLRKKIPQRSFFGSHNNNVSGNHIYNSHNIHHSFDVKSGENSKFCFTVREAIDSYDVSFTGNLSECYQVLTVLDSNKVIGSNQIVDSHDVYYSDNCYNCNNIFGCYGLRKKNYCILNKQYLKEKYQKIVPKIIENLKKSGEWGNFFPKELSPFGYNEAIVDEYMPLSKEQALAQGFKKKDNIPSTKGQGTIKYEDLLKNPEDYSDKLLEEILTCSKCEKNYKLINREINFYRKNKLSIPVMCFNCRHEARMSKRNPRNLWKGICAKCDKEILTSYTPEDQKNYKIYCEKCYQQKIY